MAEDGYGGGFAGGLGGGLSSGFGIYNKMQETKLDQQKQAFLEQRAAAADKLKEAADINSKIQDTYQSAAEHVKAVTDSGKPGEAAASVVTPLASSALELAQTGVQKGIMSPQEFSAWQAKFAALAARPAVAQDATPFQSHVTTDSQGRPMVVTTDKRDGTIKVVPASMSAAGTVAPQAAAPGNTQVAALPPGQVTGGSVTDIPPGLPAVPSSAPQGPTSQPLQVAQATDGVAGLTSDAIELRAQQWLDGNQDAFKNLPKSNRGMAVQNAIVNRGTEMAKEQGISGTELNARMQQFKAKTAGAQVIGKREATLETGIANVVATAPIVADLSSQVNRTEYPMLNQVILAGEKNVGDPKVIRLGIAVNTLVNSYARTVGGNSSQLTDSARNEAHQLLQLSYTDGQMKAAVDQMLIEMQREKHETGRALKSYLGLRDDAIRQSVPQAPPTNTFIAPGGIKFREVQ